MMGFLDFLFGKNEKLQDQQATGNTCAYCGGSANEKGKLKKYMGRHWHLACLRKMRHKAPNIARGGGVNG